MLYVIDLDEEYIEDLYDDNLKKMIIKILSDNDLSDDEKITNLVEYMVAEGIE